MELIATSIRQALTLGNLKKCLKNISGMWCDENRDVRRLVYMRVSDVCIKEVKSLYLA